MSYHPEVHPRKSTRLKGYDTTQVGAYFITLVTAERECLFGEVLDREIHLNELSQAAAEEWEG